MKISRTIAAMLVLILTLGSLSGCVSVKSYGKINNVDIPEGQFKLVLYSEISTIVQNNNITTYEDLQNLKIENVSAIDYAIDQTYDLLANSKALKALFDKNGLTFTTEDNTTLTSNVNDIITNIGGQTKYNDLLKKIGITDNDVREMQKDTIMSQKLHDKLYADQPIAEPTEDEMKAVFTKDYARVKHILCKTIDDNYQALTQEQQDAAKAKIEGIMAKIKAGEPFEDFLGDSEDPGQTSQPDGYVFTYNEMDPTFEKAAFALKPGEVSDIVQSSYGYHIIKRYELTDANYDSVKSAISTSIKNNALNAQYDDMQKKVDEIKKDLTVQKDTDKAKKINIKNWF